MSLPLRNGNDCCSSLQGITVHYIPTDTQWMLERTTDYDHTTSRGANLSRPSCLYLEARKLFTSTSQSQQVGTDSGSWELQESAPLCISHKAYGYFTKLCTGNLYWCNWNVVQSVLGVIGFGSVMVFNNSQLNQRSEVFVLKLTERNYTVIKYLTVTQTLCVC